MDKEVFQGWLDRYIEAWRSYDPAAIGDLFSEEATIHYNPYTSDVVRGREAIVNDWLGGRDEPGSWRASYSAVACDGDVCVATGTSEYLTADRSAVDKIYYNAFICQFDGEGRCKGYTEYFMQPPKPEGS
jgi:hypothetical protein